MPEDVRNASASNGGGGRTEEAFFLACGIDATRTFYHALVFADFSALDDAGEHHANGDDRQDVQEAPHC